MISKTYAVAARSLSLAAVLLAVAVATASAQPAVQTATRPATQRGTVQAVAGNSLTVAGETGAPVVVTVPDGARILQVAPGSTDLKAAQTITLSDIGVGDKVLVSGKPGDTPDAFSATRVILMKSGDIAQKRAAEQADWQKRGVGGIVSAVDPAGTVTLSSGARKTLVKTSAATVFRRYAPDSVKFEDARPGTLAQIQTGDQIEVRGARSGDGTTLQAEEIVSGSFRNLSGTLATVNPSGTVTLKDLTTKKSVTVTLTANSDLRKLPPEVAARFAARQRGTGAPAGAAPANGNAGQATGDRPSGTSPTPPSGTPPASPGGTGRPGGNGAGMDLSKMLSRLPTATLADLHTGDAVMIVASQSQSQPGVDTVTAVTLLSGVEPILAATPTGTQAMTLSPWSVGGGAPEGGGGGPQ